MNLVHEYVITSTDFGWSIMNKYLSAILFMWIGLLVNVLTSMIVLLIPVSKRVPVTHFYKQGLTLIPAWISNYIHYKEWGEITYPFLNFNGCTIEV